MTFATYYAKKRGESKPHRVSHYSYGQKAYLESSMHWRGKISTLMHRNFVNLYWIHTNFSHLKYDVFRWLIKVTIFTIQKNFKILFMISANLLITNGDAIR